MVRNFWIGVTLATVVVFGVIIWRASFLPGETSSIKSGEVVSTPTPTEAAIPKVMKIEDIKVGEGAEVKSGDVVSVHYKGTLENGTQFDSSYDRGQPFETRIGVGQVIKGWDEGIVGMAVGGKRQLVIPPELGYGQAGAGSAIPPNAILIFEVELLEIK